MAIRIITDSAADFIPADEKPNFRVLPLTIIFGTHEYKDGVDLTHTRFYELLVESDKLPKTAQVTPAQYAQAFAEAAEAGDECLVITVSSKLSGTFESAYLAAQESPCPVGIVDSLNASAGQRALVLLALKMIEEGEKNYTLDELADELNAKVDKLQVIALLDTLEFLKRGGRISSVAAGLGQMLSIKPVISTIDGKVELLGKARGSKAGRNLLSECIERAGGVDFELPVCAGYAGLSDALLKKYIADSRSLYEGRLDSVPTFSMGATIGTHSGPGAIAFGFFARG